MGLFKSNKEAEEAKKLITPDIAEQLAEYFKGLDKTVALEVFTKQGENDPFNEYAVKFCTELAELSGKITAELFELDSDQAKKREVELSPTVLVAPDAYRIRFTGAPAGEEGKSFLQAILLASTGKSRLSDMSKKLLEELTEERNVRVFASSSCPYCPGQVTNAVQCAVEKPDLISAECVEMNQAQDLTAEYGVGSVPHTFFGEGHDALGLQPQERFVLEMVHLEDAEAYLDKHGEHDHHHDMDTDDVDLVIVGAGPAGLTAGIYAERSGLSTVILEKSVVGGQVVLTPHVENYTGFTSTPGQALVDVMTSHAREYTDIREGEDVQEVKVGKNIEVVTNRRAYKAKALILATGVTWKKLGVPGEDKYFGNGVNYCATCDGYLYKGKKAAVVGGGNTALTDALHMKSLGVDITVIHRRDAFRAEKKLQEALERENIPVIWNTEVVEILGDDAKATTLKLRDKEGKEREEAFDALFVAVGHEPHVEIAEQLGITLSDNGFIKVDRGMRTNIPRIYAAGDVTGGIRQIVTATGEGSTAALSAFEDISHPYWTK